MCMYNGQEGSSSSSGGERRIGPADNGRLFLPRALIIIYCLIIVCVGGARETDTTVFRKLRISILYTCTRCSLSYLSHSPPSPLTYSFALSLSHFIVSLSVCSRNAYPRLPLYTLIYSPLPISIRPSHQRLALSRPAFLIISIGALRWWRRCGERARSRRRRRYCRSVVPSFGASGRCSLSLSFFLSVYIYMYIYLYTCSLTLLPAP